MAASRRLYGETRTALLGRPDRVTGSRKPGSRPVEGGPWWLYWTEKGCLECGPDSHSGRRSKVGAALAEDLFDCCACWARPLGA